MGVWAEEKKMEGGEKKEGEGDVFKKLTLFIVITLHVLICNIIYYTIIVILI